MDIGERIRNLRVSNDLTQEELASRCELTKGFLSQLENNLTSPSLTTLEDIVEALGYTMSEFFTDDKDEKIVFKEEDYFIDEREDSTITYIVPNAQKNEMEPIIIDLLPSSESIRLYPNDKAEEFGYVLKGNVTLVNGKKSYKVKKGETFYLSCNKETYLKNTSSDKATILWICTPPIF